MADPDGPLHLSSAPRLASSWDDLAPFWGENPSLKAAVLLALCTPHTRSLWYWAWGMGQHPTPRCPSGPMGSIVPLWCLTQCTAHGWGSFGWDPVKPNGNPPNFIYSPQCALPCDCGMGRSHWLKFKVDTFYHFRMHLLLTGKRTPVTHLGWALG